MMGQGNVDVLKLPSKGTANVSQRAGTITLTADDPVSALQAIARQANLKINLTPQEVERLNHAGKLPISLTYANNLAGASGAAKSVVDKVTETHGAAAPEHRRGVGRILAIVGALAMVAVLAFVLAYKMLERIYG